MNQCEHDCLESLTGFVCLLSKLLFFCSSSCDFYSLTHSFSQNVVNVCVCLVKYYSIFQNACSGWLWENWK